VKAAAPVAAVAEAPARGVPARFVVLGATRALSGAGMALAEVRDCVFRPITEAIVTQESKRDESKRDPAAPADAGRQGGTSRDAGRTLANRPRDPNKMGADRQFPPGVDPGDAADPGNQTPDAPPVDNRS